MRKYKSTGATDVTGFGLLGHASNLQAAQKAEVQITLHTLPIISKMLQADEEMGAMFKLRAGYSAETSGGLLAAFPTLEAAEGFIADLKAEDKTQGWVVGETRARCETDDNNARITEDARIIEVDSFYLA